MSDDNSVYWDRGVNDSYTDDDESDLDLCGFSWQFGCEEAGTEYCDWECPYRPEYQYWLDGRSNDS